VTVAANTVPETPTSRDDALAMVLSAAAFALQKSRVHRTTEQDSSHNHPIASARLLVCEGGERDPAVLAAAILRDTVEDADTTFNELERHFGAEVTDLVRELTADKRLPKQERERLQIARGAHTSAQAKAVKLAEKISILRNIRASPPAVWPLERKREYFEWAKRVVDQLRGSHPRLEELFDAEYARRP
jgi:guanosine-3',5'-bis(diphosphate) 3'-pyrophosphohydrolase